MSSLFMSLLKDTSTPKEGKQETKTEEVDAYFSLQKPAVLQEARCFNDKQINPKKCRLLIARLVFLLNQGEKFLGDESTTLFFSITKLFQSENAELRRMIYLIIREMQKEPSLYIITQSLTKDMSSKIDLFRMNSLRLAPIIIEPQYLVQSERYIKNAIIDKNTAIACSALVASFHLYPTSADFVKRWSNEILDKLSSKSPACHFHALIVLRLIKSQDKNSFVKLLVNLAKENNSNGIAAVQIIRFIREAIQTIEIDESSEKIFIEYLFKQSKKNTETIVFEATKTLCEIKSLPNKELAPIISLLSLFLSSSSSVNKFAALRILNKLISNPARVSLLANVSDIEALIKDNNKFKIE